ncbi:MAG TPA: hypothetical protein VJW94_06060 [Candidatus Acidoferrum sp.]|nr:hypothetical protein [Candidatus Acidoferrum sp.]
MGIGFVLLLWAVVGAILAGVGAVVLGGSTALLTRGVAQGRKRVILAASVFPFLCLGWAGIVFFFQAAVNEFVFHRDPGLGDTWQCPLPDGYALLMIDETEQGWVFNPKTQGGDGVAEGEDSISGVRVLQLSGPYILGGRDSHAYQFASKDDNIESYFLLDTKTGKHESFPAYEALRAKAQQLGINLNLERISAVYSRYRYTWFEAFVGLLVCGPPLLAALLLVRWIVRLRRARGLLLQPV